MDAGQRMIGQAAGPLVVLLGLLLPAQAATYSIEAVTS